jgi:nitrogen-specific signal transduction histidine kinase
MTVYFCNHVAELYLGVLNSKVQGNSFFNLFTFSANKKEEVKEIINNVILINCSEVNELDFINQNGCKTWVEMFFSRINIEGNNFIQVVLLDITERKLADTIIKEENERLRSLNELKKNLTAKTSEELKNPLNVMSKASHLLLETYKDKLDENAIRLLELINNGGETSLNLASKIVDISRIESNELILNKQTENLVEIIKNSVRIVMHNKNQYNSFIDLDLSEDVYSFIDRSRIEQVLKEILTYIILNTNNDSNLSISLQKVRNFGEILIKTQFNLGLENKIDYQFHFIKEIIELHHGQMLIESLSGRYKSSIKILLPIKKWKDKVIQLFVLYKYGIPLFDYSFSNNFTNINDPILISGGIVGLMTILKAITHGKSPIKYINHGDCTIIFELNKSEDIIFVLIVKENLKIFEYTLGNLINEFDVIYKDLVKNIEISCSDRQNWEELGLLVKKYFIN